MQDWVITILTAAGALLACLASIALTIIFSRRRDRKKEEPVGTLHVAEDPEDGAYLFLELSTPPENLYSQEYVTFWVDNMPYDIATGNEIREAHGMDRFSRSQ